jgi:hypothetical protein
MSNDEARRLIGDAFSDQLDDGTTAARGIPMDADEVAALAGIEDPFVAVSCATCPNTFVPARTLFGVSDDGPICAACVAELEGSQ